MEKFEFEDYSVTISKNGDKQIQSHSGNFHLLFRRKDGFTAKWGKKPEDNPAACPWGPEIADIEVTTICRGIRDPFGKRSPCRFCYKSNTSNGEYLSYEDFVKIFALLKQPKTLNQIAFGVDAECKGNPDLWKIMDYCLINGVIPNITVADIDREVARNIVEKCGACSVSIYQRDKNRGYDSVALLLEEAKKQDKPNFRVNLHLLLSEETLEFVKEVVEDTQKDPRLKGMFAIIFLSLKQKGRGEDFHPLQQTKKKELILSLLDRKIPFGMDSCGVPSFLESIKDRKDYSQIEQFVESCESFMFSIYVNVKGEVFPCSFMEGKGEWEEGIPLLSGKFQNFSKEIWNSEKVLKWREHSKACIECKGRNECPFYEV